MARSELKLTMLLEHYERADITAVVSSSVWVGHQADGDLIMTQWHSLAQRLQSAIKLRICTSRDTEYNKRSMHSNKTDMPRLTLFSRIHRARHY